MNKVIVQTELAYNSDSLNITPRMSLFAQAPYGLCKEILIFTFKHLVVLNISHLIFKIFFQVLNNIFEVESPPTFYLVFPLFFSL